MGFAIFHEMSVFFHIFGQSYLKIERAESGVKFFRKLRAWKKSALHLFVEYINGEEPPKISQNFFSDDCGELHFLLILNSKENDDEFLKKACSSKICTK